MAFVEDMFKGGNIATGLAVGLGMAVVAPVIVPILRPLAKTVIKAGLIAYDQGRTAVAELNERTGDIVGEARAELAESGAATEDEPGRRRGRRSEGTAPA
ncbi:DUF5132 domain-containing protein [Microvirga sp. VF16]|uniref:DUF5132 domain-containing protein n=1 Tax=Microvirga sp. VF16 TaxID=2807101 RepID=UPI00193E7F8C|nr:DUF5132 domain-containing protein [Microvirga sp. VF16]QRM32543.1 DUF5132 domain-containing protein [Microvirga sp. VF16]